MKQEIKAENDQDYFNNYDDFSFDNDLKSEPDEKPDNKEVNQETKKPYTCPTCNKRYTKEKKYHKHLELHRSQYSCMYCKKLFLREEALQKHIRKHDNRCQICSDIFIDGSLLLQHIASHNSSTIKNEQEIESNDNKQTYPCEKCEKIYKNPRSLALHMKKHKREEPVTYTCDVCQKEFVSKALVKRHMKLHVQDRPFKCTSCSRSYSRSDQLNVHLRTHAELKPNVCPYCNKGMFLNSITNMKTSSCHDMPLFLLLELSSCCFFTDVIYIVIYINMICNILLIT